MGCLGCDPPAVLAKVLHGLKLALTDMLRAHIGCATEAALPFVSTRIAQVSWIIGNGPTILARIRHNAPPAFEYLREQVTLLFLLNHGLKLCQQKETTASPPRSRRLALGRQSCISLLLSEIFFPLAEGILEGDKPERKRSLFFSVAILASIVSFGDCRTYVKNPREGEDQDMTVRFMTPG